jgi:hypothetical protein
MMDLYYQQRFSSQGLSENDLSFMQQQVAQHLNLLQQSHT